MEEFADDSINKMIDVTNNLILLAPMTFGKHKGRKFDEIPVG